MRRNIAEIVGEYVIIDTARRFVRAYIKYRADEIKTKEKAQTKVPIDPPMERHYAPVKVDIREEHRS